MGLVSKDILLVDYTTFKAHNGFILPFINEEDKENGITTPEKKYELWSYHTQIMLNAVLQDELSNSDYDLKNMKPWVQKALINIMTTRLNRAFKNDEIIDRDAQVNFNQQGGVNYTNTPSVDAKGAMYSFFNGKERLLIETSGILESTFSEDIGLIIENIEDNQFQDGVFVPDVKWSDKADNTITYKGNNITVQNAFDLIASGKVSASDVLKQIKEATGLNTDATKEAIKVHLNKYIKYETIRLNKAKEELAQVDDVQKAEARSRSDIVGLQKALSKSLDLLSSLKERVSSVEEAEDLIGDVWNGSVVLTGDDDLSVLETRPGIKINLKDGSRHEVYIKRTSANSGVGHNIKVGDATQIDFVIPVGSGQSEHIQAKITIDGHLHTKEQGSGNLGDYEIFRIISTRKLKGIGNFYDKNEIDKQMSKKQNKEDQTLTTNDKTVIGAINEEVARVDTINTRVDTLNGKDVIVEDGTTQDLDQIAEPLITEKRTKKLIAAIPAGGGGGNFTENDYFTKNANLLTKNDKIHADQAYIGKDYGGNQYYGSHAVGKQHYGYKAVGKQSYGEGSYNELSIWFAENDEKGKVIFQQHYGDHLMYIYVDGVKGKRLKDI